MSKRGSSFFRESLRRLSQLGTRSRFHSELSDEMDAHIQDLADEYEQGGMSRADALAKARRRFGSPLKVGEQTTDIWRIGWIEDLGSDLRHALRAFRRNPGFALTAIFCLAIGIGANITIFSVTTAFLFSQPSCRDSQSLMAIWEAGNSHVGMADYNFVRDAHVFEGTAGINVEREVNWRDGERTSRFFVAAVTDDFFNTLGVPLLTGRGIAPGEKYTVVLSYGLWRRVFNGDAAILGRKLILDGRLYTVVGVLPRDHRSIFGFGVAPELYMPVLNNDDYVQLYVRRPSGMGFAAARERVQSIFERLDQFDPRSDLKRTRGTRTTSVVGFDVLSQNMPGAITAFFALLAAVVGLVLLIACTNVAGLLLARAASRSHEIAIRLSLGASRRRIIRHLLAESLLLAGLAAVAGFALDLACTAVINRVALPIPVPVHLVVSPDWRLLWYSLLTIVVSTVLCGLLPALKAVRKPVNSALKQEEHQTARVWNLRSVLVAGQLALSIVLLATAFLFVHNLLRATSMSPGFDVQHTIWAYMRLVPERYQDPEQRKQTALVHAALAQLRALPGVESASITRHVALNGNCVTGVDVATDLAPHPSPVRYQCNSVGPDYFQTMGIRLLSGREFSLRDEKGAAAVAIVNESFARKVFGKRNPVGHVITDNLPQSKPRLIVGVVADSKYMTLSENQQLAVYRPYFAESEPVNLGFLVRAERPSEALVKSINDTLGRLDASAAIETKPMSRALGLALLPSRAGAILLGTMGALGLILAAIGLYGVLLYSVARRTREIGLRVALGATSIDVLKIVWQHSLVLIGSGSIAGLALALFVMRPLSLFLVQGLNTFDPLGFAGVVAALSFTGLMATFAPAVRALRVDPMTALRYE